MVSASSDMMEAMLTCNSILCSDFAIKRIDEPFVEVREVDEWAL